jgi:hypothetical protein
MKKTKKRKPEKKLICLPTPRVERLMKDQVHHEVSPWRIFKIMAEFVSGYEFLKKYKKAVTFFGTARVTFHSDLYKQATHLAFRLSKDGYAVMTGGGPGIMEAANKGAHDAGGVSVGVNIRLPFEQRTNRYVVESEAFKYFFVRKTMLAFASQVYIFFPGGYGTMDELFEMLTLVQTKKIDPTPIILVNKEFWTPLLSWVKEYLYEKNKAIDEEDMHLYYLADDDKDAYEYINKLMYFKEVKYDAKKTKKRNYFD